MKLPFVFHYICSLVEYEICNARHQNKNKMKTTQKKLERKPNRSNENMKRSREIASVA